MSQQVLESRVPYKAPADQYPLQPSGGSPYTAQSPWGGGAAMATASSVQEECPPRPSSRPGEVVRGGLLVHCPGQEDSVGRQADGK